MPATIDYYFATVSPWAYLGHARFVAMAQAAGATVRVKPVDYGVIFPASGGLPLAKRAPQRQAYRLVELKRFSDFLGIPLHTQPAHFPVNGNAAAQLILAADAALGSAAALDLAGRVGAAIWAQQRNVADPAVLAALVAEEEGQGQPDGAKVNKTRSPSIRSTSCCNRQRNLRPEQADAASKQILERLIDQQLALQKADDLKLDRDPRVVQQLEAARRDILARAYVDKLGEGVAKPTAEEIKKYYDEKPALFSQRRIYNIQEIAIESKPEQVGTLREKLAASKNVNEFLDYLKANDIRFAGNQAVRAAEQLPLASLDAFAKMQDGQAMLVPSANGVQVIVLAGSRSAPVGEEQARPAIEQFILNDRKRKLVEEDVKAMRALRPRSSMWASLQEAAASAPAGAAPAPAPAPAVAPAVTAPAPVAPTGACSQRAERR